MTTSLQSVDSGRTLLALCAMMVVSLGTLQVQPILGGAFVDQLGFSLQAIGSVFATELSAMALACGLSALAMPRINRRRFAGAALAVLVLGNLASLQAGSPATLLAARLACGLGSGAVMAVVYATAALRSSKDATFAAINAGNLLWGMLLVSSAPWLLKAGGIGSIFVLLGICSAMAWLGCARIPDRAASAQGAAPPGC
ncbi:MAG: hypothetical protein GAK30_03481 [Paracidovorax wautersii]|uniref:Major Facilitator Superfamily protein n=1 Tax=Paracidovorax wautersii TaxID=1177982 RepID=A0A7V8JNS8_9BURK|nr:MAG: hypothetical protein GAK30_03481 [Paracidovorax wautersii]